MLRTAVYGYGTPVVNPTKEKVRLWLEDLRGELQAKGAPLPGMMVYISADDGRGFYELIYNPGIDVSGVGDVLRDAVLGMDIGAREAPMLDEEYGGIWWAIGNDLREQYNLAPTLVAVGSEDDIAMPKIIIEREWMLREPPRRSIKKRTYQMQYSGIR